LVAELGAGDRFVFAGWPEPDLIRRPAQTATAAVTTTAVALPSSGNGFFII
jgi:hypothetical protein